MYCDTQKNVYPEIKRKKFKLLTSHFDKFLNNRRRSIENFNITEKRSPKEPIIEINIPICVGYNEDAKTNNWVLNKAICVKVLEEFHERGYKAKIWLFENPKKPGSIKEWKNRHPIIPDHLSRYILDSKDYMNTEHWKNCYSKFNNLLLEEKNLEKKDRLMCNALKKDLKNARSHKFAQAMSYEENKEHIIKDTVFCLSWMSPKTDNNGEKLPQKVVLILYYEELFFSMKMLVKLSEKLGVFEFVKSKLGGDLFDRDAYMILDSNWTSQCKELKKTSDRSTSLFNDFFIPSTHSSAIGQYISINYLAYQDKQAMGCVSKSFYSFFRPDSENQGTRSETTKLQQKTEKVNLSFKNQNF